jgi:hypothetical protein
MSIGSVACEDAGLGASMMFAAEQLWHGGGRGCVPWTVKSAAAVFHGEPRPLLDMMSIDKSSVGKKTGGLYEGLI